VAEGIADLLLKSFSISAVTVSVIKRPSGLPAGSSATFQCRRERGA
jgi:hypothetical protein